MGETEEEPQDRPPDIVDSSQAPNLIEEMAAAGEGRLAVCSCEMDIIP